MNGNGAIFGAILIIWVGIFAYLIGLDRKLSRIEKQLKR